jgi:hypothetical protein
MKKFGKLYDICDFLAFSPESECLPICYLKCINVQNCNFVGVLHGRETWTDILREEHRLRVPKKILGAVKVEVTEDW